MAAIIAIISKGGEKAGSINTKKRFSTSIEQIGDFEPLIKLIGESQVLHKFPLPKESNSKYI